MKILRAGVVLIFISLIHAAERKGTPVQQAPAKYIQLQNPFEGTQSAAQAGQKLFARECAACHGKNAGGIGKAPPLVTPDVSRAAPGALFWVLRNGSMKRGMPSFAHLPEPQRWQIVSYLKSLGPLSQLSVH